MIQKILFIMLNLVISLACMASTPHLPSDVKTPNEGYNRFQNAECTLAESNTKIKLSYGIDYWFSKDASNAKMNVLLCIWDSKNKQFINSQLTGAKYIEWRKYDFPSKEDIYNMTLDSLSLPNVSQGAPLGFTICIYLISNDWKTVYDQLFFGTFTFDGSKIKEFSPYGE